MTSVPIGRTKGKGRAPSDWHLRAITNIPSSEQLSRLALPMEAMPEQTDSVPAEFTGNTRYLVAGMPEAGPWTGYYANYRGAKIAVSNIYGVWFEIRWRGTGFKAHHQARRE